MKEVLLLKNGELVLKGLNRRTFEDILLKNLRRRLSSLGEWRFGLAQSTITAEPVGDEIDLDEAVAAVSRVFGLAGYSRAAVLPKDMDVILSQAGGYLAPLLEGARSFKVEAKRSDKAFPFNSPAICAALGERLLDEFPSLTVDVHSPEVVVTVEIRDTSAYVHGNQQRGAGGMPCGSAGKAALLISGGIDSPVAGWMMAKRGLSLTGIHFASPPYTSQRAEMKVHTLLEKVSLFSGRITLFTVPFTDIQEQIKDNCPEELFTIIMRRMMMRVSEIIARREDCGALITGESVGQVASQTLYALACTDAVTSMPVFRPLIGMDKDEVVTIARKIDTFDTSVLPYEDCCTVFTPRHPRTHPKLKYVEQAETAFDFAPLIEAAARDAVKKIIN